MFRKQGLGEPKAKKRGKVYSPAAGAGKGAAPARKGKKARLVVPRSTFEVDRVLRGNASLPAASSPVEVDRVVRGKPGRKPIPRPPTAQRMNLVLDSKKIMRVRGILHVQSNQEAVERIVDRFLEEEEETKAIKVAIRETAGSDGDAVDVHGTRKFTDEERAMFDLPPARTRR